MMACSLGKVYRRNTLSMRASSTSRNWGQKTLHTHFQKPLGHQNKERVFFSCCCLSYLYRPRACKGCKQDSVRGRRWLQWLQATSTGKLRFSARAVFKWKSAILTLISAVAPKLVLYSPWLLDGIGFSNSQPGTSQQ